MGYPATSDTSASDAGMPVFETREQCRDWSRRHVLGSRSHHSEQYKHLHHVVTTAVTWGDVLFHLSGNMLDECCSPWSVTWGMSGGGGQRLESCEERVPQELRANVRSKLAASNVNPLAALNLTEHACVNTLRYLFHHMRCGIYVRIRNNAVNVFLPFANGDGYTNTWSQQVSYRGHGRDHAKYELQRRGAMSEKQYAARLADPSRWWANAGIICETPDAQVWGDSFLSLLRSVLDDMCKTRQVESCSFFVNKRDHPQIRAPLGPNEPRRDPQRFLWEHPGHGRVDSAQTVEPPVLPRERYRLHLPVLSFYTGPAFSDVGMPTHEDWMTCTGKAYPPDGQQMVSADCIVRIAAAKRWEDRRPRAVWRGSNTGPGQRQYLCDLSAHPHVSPFVDARITKHSTRDRIDHPQGCIYFDAVSEERRRQAKEAWMSVEAQMDYKYCVYVCGHSAAARYGSMLLRGSTVIEVEPPDAVEGHELWFFPMLKRTRAWKHGGGAGDPEIEDAHVLLVRHDLSDLVQCVEWCIAHDDAARRIALNGQRLARVHVLNRDAMLDYMQTTINAIGAGQGVHVSASLFACPWNERMMDVEWPPYLA